MYLYRYLTGPDDAAFCARVTTALNLGWELYGAPTMTFNGVNVIAVSLPERLRRGSAAIAGHRASPSPPRATRAPRPNGKVCSARTNCLL
jgi:Domain of unknown function (DUF1737)